MEYLHGFDKKEQQRLIHQAQILEPFVYADVDFGKGVKRLGTAELECVFL
ncbi:MAG: hypothetical protein JNL11_01100 [Bdellovibrionaceae bacterium]|nr:hypothetical protein [Pseudobdellovibrionaceae bacterium]